MHLRWRNQASVNQWLKSAFGCGWKGLILSKRILPAHRSADSYVPCVMLLANVR